ncbi:ABC transporter permease [Ornithinibacillus halophilus]|uniref:ABC-type transport system involved in multi-copper enzyme maturation, permease component n=1 Tax=Ornithinibacillus halophilus TaxID=930117 RepID=A0A1M5INW7_9BACI|nr:ABC transporter permease subunit [Ornithinibacillus halophilus]SHG30002.1 ABC-type transport system involved in multi-copper enzyme maturation, permease component [Ornithinibacillus halophilus]
MKLFLFELKKFAWTKKFLIILIALVCSVVFLFIRNVLFQDYAQEQKNEEIALFIETSSSKDSGYTSQLERLGNNEEVEMKQELNLTVLNLARELRNVMATEDDWKTELTVENRLLVAISEYKATGEDYPISDEDISHRIAMNHTLLDLEIPPEFEHYSTAFPNFLKQVVDLFISYSGLIIVLLLIGEIMTREFENRSINLLFTLPLNRTKLILGKYFSALLTSVFTFFFIIAVGALIGKLFGAEGSFAYPVLIEKEGHLYYMSTMDYLQFVVLLFAIMLLFVIALYIYYSLVFKHLLASLLAIIATLIGGYQLGNFINWTPFAWVNPFQYTIPKEAILYQNEHLFYQGISVTLLATLLLVVISILRIKRNFN